MYMFLSIILLIFAIWKISDAFQSASNYLGRNLSHGVRGAVINAVGSSAPELFICLIALFFGTGDFANDFAFGLGASSGSAIFNTIIIPAFVILVLAFFTKTKSFVVNKSVIKRDGIFLICLDILLILILTFGVITWWVGLLLMLTYLLYIYVLKLSMKKSDFAKKDKYISDLSSESRWASLLKLDLRNFIFKGELNNFKASFLLILSMALLGITCHFLIDVSNEIAHLFSIHPFFIAVTITAAATSIPDMIISIKDSLVGDYEDATANVLGSNIFDLAIGIGLPVFLFCLINDTNIVLRGSEVNEYMPFLRFAIISSDLLMLWLFMKRVNVKSGLIFLGYYALFMISLFTYF